jgi:uncharacterized protein (TIGR03435 family)
MRFYLKMSRFRLPGLLIPCCAVVLPVHGQAPQFDVASIRPQPWTNEGGVNVFVRGNILYGEHADLYRLVDFAYDLRSDDLQLSGGPAWARHGVLSNVAGGDSILYQVIAKAPDGPPPSTAQFRLMLQALLADRFQLKIHHVNRGLPVFNLVIAKDGPKFPANLSNVKESLSMRDGSAFRMSAVHVPLAKLVEELAYAAGRPVIDKTGLAGFYDFEIAWSPRFLRDDIASADRPAPDAPSMFAALEKLGLKLEPGTAPYDTIVIDHAEQPTGN